MVVYQPEEDIGPIKRFFKKEWFRIVYLILISLLSSLIFFVDYTGCLSSIIVPVLAFTIPYWLKERKIRRFLLNGLVLLFFILIFLSVIWITILVTTPKPNLSSNSGDIRLDNGTVDPHTSSGTTTFLFSVEYTNINSVNASDVRVTLKILRYATGSVQDYGMTSDFIGSSSQGWTFNYSVTLTEDVYAFWFNANTTNSPEIETSWATGPINAPWTSYLGLIVPYVLIGLLIPMSMYYIIVGLFWWIEKAKQMRGPMIPSTPPKLKSEFECTNCGADVTAEDIYCSRCGAYLEGIEESVEKQKKTDRESAIETEKKAMAKRKEK